MVPQASIMYGPRRALSNMSLWQALRNREFGSQNVMATIDANGAATTRHLATCHGQAAALAGQLEMAVSPNEVVAVATSCPLEALVWMWACVEAGLDFGLVDPRVPETWFDRLQTTLGSVSVGSTDVAGRHKIDLVVDALEVHTAEPAQNPPPRLTERVFVATSGSAGAARIAWRSATVLADAVGRTQCRNLSAYSAESAHGGVEGDPIVGPGVMRLLVGWWWSSGWRTRLG